MDFGLTPELRALRNRARRRFTCDVLHARDEAAFERAPWGLACPGPRQGAGATGVLQPLEASSIGGRPACRTRRLAAQGRRRPGLVGDGAGDRPRAVRPGDRRPVVVRARAPTTSCSTAIPVQRQRYLDPSIRGERSGSYAITERDAGSDARTMAASAKRRPGHRRVRPERREVVRDRPGRHRLHDLPGDGRGRRAAPADAVPGRLRHARPAPEPRPGLHAHVRRPAPPVRARGRARAGRRDPRRDRPGRSVDQRMVRRGADPHRGPLQRGDGAAAHARRGVGDRAGSSSASGSTTSRG